MAARDHVPGLGNLLRQAREAAGLTMKDVEAISGVAQPNLSRYEAETKVPSIATLQRLAKAYNVDACKLMTEGMPLPPVAPEIPKGKRK